MNKNDAVITNAFVRLASKKHMLMTDALKGLLDDTVMFIFEQHMADGHPNHLEYGDTYGWALYYKGILVEMKVNRGPEISEFSVSEELTNKIKATPGYVGVIMAGMDPEEAFWLVHEEKYLETAKDMIAAEYHRFFRKV